MRAFTIPSLLLTLTLSAAACGPDSPTEPVRADALDAVHSAHASDRHTVRGSCNATGIEVQAFIPPILHQVATATCEISHLGRVSIRTVQQVNVATGVQIGDGTWTTASGDLVYAQSVGTAVPNGPATIHFTGVSTISGGTGRFASADGEVAVEGSVDTVTGLGSFTYYGWIVYAARDRADR